MAQWKGWRKVLTVLAFIGPTLIGVLIFNIYPILFNTFISFTNRGKFHPNADCSVGLTSILEPTCWQVFRKNAPIGLAEPYRLKEPIFGNYIDLIGQLFTKEVLIALGIVIGCLLPLIIAGQINKFLDRKPDRPISRGAVTISGIIMTVILAVVLNGLQNFQLIRESGDFLTVNMNSILYTAICIPLFLIVALVLALLLNVSDLPGRAFFRVVLIVPWAASTVAIMMSLVWQFFFREVGTINQLLEIIGIPSRAWLNDPLSAWFVIIIANVWYSYPFFMVTILGALQSIPGEIYEAAEVDGATYWHRLTKITLPLIRPAVIPAIVLSSITTFQMFGTVWAITNGNPSAGAGAPGATDMVMTYAYKQVFQTQAYARMGAFAVIIFIMLFIATLYSLRISRVTKGAYE